MQLLPILSYSLVHVWPHCQTYKNCYLLRHKLTSTFMHTESILTPCQKVGFKHSKIIFLLVPYTSMFILQQGWHIYIEGVFLILCNPSIIISIPARIWGLVQKYLESTLFLIMYIGPTLVCHNKCTRSYC